MINKWKENLIKCIIEVSGVEIYELNATEMDVAFDSLPGAPLKIFLFLNFAFILYVLFNFFGFFRVWASLNNQVFSNIVFLSIFMKLLTCAL